MVTFPAAALTADAVIVSGPPKTGEYRRVHELLAARGDHRIAISTGTAAEEFRKDHTSSVGDGVDVRVVDCITAGRGNPPADDGRSYYVDSPGNLTQIGVKVTALLEAVEAASAVVGLQSLSPILRHAGVEPTDQFAHLLAKQTGTEGWPLVATRNAEGHDERTRNAIAERFGCILGPRTADGHNEFRARGTRVEPSPWQPIVDDGADA